MKKLVLVIVSMLFLLACSSKNFEVTVAQGVKFPDFTLKSIDGKQEFKSTDVIKKDQKTLFVIAAEWCPHCKVEAVEIQKFYEENKDKANVIVIFSDYNSSPEIVTEYLEKNKYTFPAYYDHGNVFINGTKLESFPFNLIIGKDGKIEEILEGEVTAEALAEKLLK